jgi:hypothetical protein
LVHRLPLRKRNGGGSHQKLPATPILPLVVSEGAHSGASHLYRRIVYVICVDDRLVYGNNKHLLLN